MLTECRTQAPPHTIARDRRTDGPTHRERNARRCRRRSEHGASHFEISRPAPSPTGERLKRCLTTNAPDQADRLARPLPRRRRITARPARFRIRRRNPCFFFRFRLFGWYVRFTHGLLERPGRGGAPGRARGSFPSARAQVNGRVYGLITNLSNPPHRPPDCPSRQSPLTSVQDPCRIAIGISRPLATCWHTPARGDSVPLPRWTGRPPLSGTSPWPRRRNLGRRNNRPGAASIVRRSSFSTRVDIVVDNRGVGSGHSSSR